MKRKIPAKVARQLRQEAGFGCVVCGCPIIEYHHIIEWHDVQHHDPEHMVCLCGTHHTELGKQRKDKAYLAKRNPFNIRHRRFDGYLVTNKTNQGLLVGSMRFDGCKSAIAYNNCPVFAYQIVDKEILLQTFIPDPHFWPEIEVRDNEVIAEVKNFWDIEFRSNYLRFRKKSGTNFLSIDLRGDDVIIEGELALGASNITMNKNYNIVDGVRFEGGGATNCRIGLAIGNNHLIRPNFAMRRPQALLI